MDRELALKAISLLQYLLLFIIIDFFVAVFTDVDALLSHAPSFLLVSLATEELCPDKHTLIRFC